MSAKLLFLKSASTSSAVTLTALVASQRSISREVGRQRRKGPTRNSIVRKKFIFLAHKMDLIIVPKKGVCGPFRTVPLHWYYIRGLQSSVKF